MSESELPERLDPAHSVSVEDVRALVGPATPHFALQIRNRVRRLIDPLPERHPARIEGERQIARLDEIAQHTGEARGPGPGSTMAPEAGADHDAETGAA